MRRLILAAAAALMLAGCQTGRPSAEDAMSARLSAFDGRTMAAFMSETGLTPQDMYPVRGGRVFVFEGSPVTLTFPGSYGAPTVSRTSSCRLLVQTAQRGKSGTADDWEIVGTSRTGPCAA